jgi:hypothetical protein
MTIIRRSSNGDSYVYKLTPPGRRVCFSIQATRELSRDECFAEVAKFLRSNLQPRRGSVIQLHALTEPREIGAVHVGGDAQARPEEEKPRWPRNPPAAARQRPNARC